LGQRQGTCDIYAKTGSVIPGFCGKLNDNGTGQLSISDLDPFPFFSSWLSLTSDLEESDIYVEIVSIALQDLPTRCLIARAYDLCDKYFGNDVRQD